MYPKLITFVGFLSLVSSAPPSNSQHNKVVCPIIFEGRVLRNQTLSSFDTTASPYSPTYVKGENLTWSSILLLPNISHSRFDNPSVHRPLEVTINDASLFRPGGGDLQIGFRRAGLLLKDDKNNIGADPADNGVVTFHWSIRQDSARPLNLSHEYMNVWHERADYAGNQFTFVGGVVLEVDGGTGKDTKEERESWKIQGRGNEILFRTPILFDKWQNFAVQLDYVNNTLQVFYSEGKSRLKARTNKLKNDNSGGGQLQLGIAKKPTETKTVVYDGYHESIRGSEGQIYGGIFVEDSTNGCLST